MKFEDRMEELKAVIVKSYEEGVTLDEAERLAARFLEAMMDAAERLRVADLDARMKKTGVKAVKAAVYHEEVSKADKKPSDTFLQALVDKNEVVQGEQDQQDKAEVLSDYYQNCFNILKDGHVYFRGIAKGRFE